jgi:hypothetical protein
MALAFFIPEKGSGFVQKIFSVNTLVGSGGSSELHAEKRHARQIIESIFFIALYFKY